MVVDQQMQVAEGQMGPSQGGASAERTARLLLLPAPAPATPEKLSRSQGWREDVAELGLRRLAAFLAEAAVLVLVLGLLERLLAVHRVEWGWTAAVVGISAGLLGGSVGLELLERRRG